MSKIIEMRCLEQKRLQATYSEGGGELGGLLIVGREHPGLGFGDLGVVLCGATFGLLVCEGQILEKCGINPPHKTLHRDTHNSIDVFRVL